MLVIDLKDPRPLYQQVVDGIKAAIARGELAPGDALPSVRDLAETLAANPNTIAHAYRELQVAGVIHVRQGKGAWVAQPPSPAAPEQIERLREQLRRLLADAYHQGVSTEQILQLMQAEISTRESGS
jgi:GntR family transcriptional regulator